MVVERWNATMPKSLKRRVAETAEMETRSRSRQSSGFIVELVSSPATAVPSTTAESRLTNDRCRKIEPRARLQSSGISLQAGTLNRQPSPASQIRCGGLSALRPIPHAPIDRLNGYVDRDRPNICLFYLCERSQGFGCFLASREIRRCRGIPPLGRIESRDVFLRIALDQIQYPSRGLIKSGKAFPRHRATWRDTNPMPLRFRSPLRGRIESFAELAFKRPLDFLPGDSGSGVIGSSL